MDRIPPLIVSFMYFRIILAIFRNSVAIYSCLYSLHHYHRGPNTLRNYPVSTSNNDAHLIIFGGKKLLAQAGIEPKPSDIGIRNATITAGCSVHKHIAIHCLYDPKLYWD